MVRGGEGLYTIFGDVRRRPGGRLGVRVLQVALLIGLVAFLFDVVSPLTPTPIATVNASQANQCISGVVQKECLISEIGAPASLAVSSVVLSHANCARGFGPPSAELIDVTGCRRC